MLYLSSNIKYYIMAKATKFPYGKVSMFGRDIPLTKDGKLNQVYLSAEEKEWYNEYLEGLKKDNKAHAMADFEATFPRKK
jgi:hypothetical protein